MEVQNVAEYRRELGRVTAERDALRLELDQVLETNGWWGANASQSSTPSGFAFSSNQIAAVGALTRQVCMLKEQVQDVMREKWTEVQKEREIARTLRVRIDELEQWNRKNRLRSIELEEELNVIKKELEEERAMKASQDNALASQLADVRETLAAEKKLSARLKKTITELESSKAEVEAELLAHRHHATASVKSPAPTRILQAQQPNVTPLRAKAPITPQKRKPAPPDNPLESSPMLSPTTSLADRFAFLEERHGLLREEYKKLRTRYHNDLKHWKEYKAMEVARIELKKQRKVERKAAKQKARPAEDVPVDVGKEVEATGPDHQVLGAAVCDETQEVVQLHAPVEQQASQDKEDESVKEESAAEDRFELVAASDDSQSLSQPQQKNDGDEEPEKDDSSSATATEEAVDDPAQPRQPPIVVQPEPVQSVVTPRVPEHRRLGPTASRTTPWLGNDASGNSTPITNRAIRTPQGDDGDLAIKTGAPTTNPNTPLARDRGIAPDTMRKAALQRNMSGLGTPGMSDSVKKRKADDMTSMTPEQRAQHLKKLNMMPVAEKRAYYAEYKGQGRYLPPDQVRTGVFDEFEIDPKQNEGANFQFHDVKRQKAERRKMHGGDCECCKEYYEAVGHIPRFNVAPKWKDDSQSDGEGKPSDEALKQEHLNKVSRHRETWKRAPTPPGYWDIGFPNTQVVAEQNAKADEMVQHREEQVRRDAAHKDSKWRQKA